MDLLKDLKWRYATKKFDTNRKVRLDELEKLKEAVQLAPSSYGLQLYKILVIESSEIRKRLKSVSSGQDQVSDASHLIVFCNYSAIADENIEEHIHLVSKIRNVPIDGLKDYENFLKKKITEMTDTEKQFWTVKQTYLALGNLLTACAHLKIDACPMEGFEPGKYNQILNLAERGLNASVIAAIGYRSEHDQMQKSVKVRKPLESLFEIM